MANLKLFISHDCTSCNGTGVRPNPDYNAAEPFPEEPLDTCMGCNGTKRVERWVTVAEFLEFIEQEELQDLATLADDVLGQGT